MSPPLAGLTILVTRPTLDADGLARQLADLGAQTWIAPATTVSPPADWAPVDAMLDALASYDWVAFTSANGVRSVAARALETARPLPATSPPFLVAVGPATAEALARSWRTPEAVPTVYLTAAVAGAMGVVSGKRIALPRADIARHELPAELRRLGARVDEIEAYTVRASDDPHTPARLVTLSGGNAPRYITLTSPSAARGLHAMLQSAGLDRWLHEARLACIGPVTADAVRQLGFTVACSARVHTAEGLISALMEDHAQHGD